MDFHCLSRKDLQALCKKNKIPANMTNIAMADALQALEHVEGLEEILNPAESDCQQLKLGMESAPRTATRTSTRQKQGKVELGSSKEIFNGANSTMSPVVPTTRRRAPAASARKKLEIENKDDEGNECKINNVFETPGVQSSRRCGTVRNLRKKIETPHEENSLQKACSYGTRRSMRLLEKRIADLSLGHTERKESTKSSKISVDAIDKTEEINKVLGLDSESAAFSESDGIDDASIGNKTSNELESKVSDSKLDLGHSECSEVLKSSYEFDILEKEVDELESKVSDSKLDFGHPDDPEVMKSSDESDIPEKEVGVRNETQDNDNNICYHTSSEQVNVTHSTSDDCDAPGGESKFPVLKNVHETMAEAYPTDPMLSSQKIDSEVELETIELTEELKDEVVAIVSENPDTLSGSSLDVQVGFTNEDLLGYQLPSLFHRPTVVTAPKKNVDDDEDVGEAESKDTVKEDDERIFGDGENNGEEEIKDSVNDCMISNDTVKEDVERIFGDEENNGEEESNDSVNEDMISNEPEQQVERNFGEKEDDGEAESKSHAVKENMFCDEFEKLSIRGLRREIKKLDRILKLKSENKNGDIEVEGKRIALLPVEENRRPVAEGQNKNRDV